MDADNLKIMDKEMKGNFFKFLCQTVAREYDLESAYNVNAGIHKFIIFTKPDMDGDQILTGMNKLTYHTMIEFFETETEDRAEQYDRNITMFESEVNEVNIIITW